MFVLPQILLDPLNKFMWTIFDRAAQSFAVDPDPFVFSAKMSLHTFFSSQERTCVLWCVDGTNVCMGASILDSDSWESSSIEGQWRFVDGGKLILLASQTALPLAGPQWFLDACSSSPLTSPHLPRGMHGSSYS